MGTRALLTFRSDAFSGDDEQHATWIANSLNGLTTYIEHFVAALSLFDYCEMQLNPSNKLQNSEVFAAWQRLAARDGAMSARHFARSMISAQNALGQCQNALSKVNRKDIGAANKLFDNTSPAFMAYAMRSDTRRSLAQTRNGSPTIVSLGPGQPMNLM